MAKCRGKTSSQLRGRDQFDPLEGTAEEDKEMALLSPLARARHSMERELSIMLQRSSPKGSGWKVKRAHDLRALAKGRGSKTGSSKGRI